MAPIALAELRREIGFFCADRAVDSFELGSITRLDEGPFFLVRDDEGLYAMAAVCTHRGCVIAAVSTTLRCPCHGSVFDLDGAVITGPAPLDLDHFAVTLDGDGAAVVDSTQVVPPSTRTTT